MREGKGGKDRVVMLPRSLLPALRRQVSVARQQWEADREAHESRISEKMLVEVPLPRLNFDTMRIEVQCEEDQRWIAEVLDLPGVMAYGDTRDQAVARAESLALRVIADRIDHGESIPELDDLFVVSA